MSRRSFLRGSVLALALLLCAGSASWADFAAIAYSRSTGTYGYSYGQPSRGDAEAVALNNCDAGDARIVVWVENGYAALALGDQRGAYGYGWSTVSRADAERIALDGARDRTSGVYVAQWVFSGN